MSRSVFDNEVRANNLVRLPLNEDCWLNINGAPAQYSGQAYQDAIVGFVNSLNSFDIFFSTLSYYFLYNLRLNVILDLHWAAPGTQQAKGQIPMPDADHSPDFWASVAQTFKNNSAVIFDLYNEPYLTNDEDSADSWNCWKVLLVTRFFLIIVEWRLVLWFKLSGGWVSVTYKCSKRCWCKEHCHVRYFIVTKKY
jgi:hypothetical protein